jgi:hypothetical protein
MHYRAGFRAKGNDRTWILNTNEDKACAERHGVRQPAGAVTQMTIDNRDRAGAQR